MPAITNSPSNNSITLNFLRTINGSNTAVKKPTAEKQTNATDTFENLMEPKKLTQCNEAMKPTPNILNRSARLTFCNRFINPNSIHMVMALMNNRHQTNNPSFSVMSRPSIPVKPARKTAMWSWRKAFRMLSELGFGEIYGIGGMLSEL